MIERAVLQFDGGCRPANPGPASCAWLISVDGLPVAEGSEYIGVRTNNEAEYTGLLRGLQEANALNVQTLLVHSDSQVVVKQMRGEYRVKSDLLRPLHQEACGLALMIPQVTYAWNPRLENKRCDAMCTAVLDRYYSEVRG